MSSPLEKTKTAGQPQKQSSNRGITLSCNHFHLIFVVLGISFVLTIFIGAILYFFILLDIPAIQSLTSYQPATTTVIYDNNNNIVSRLYRHKRTVIPLSSMPSHLPQAFIAAEDARFYEHSGVDIWSILRALLHNLKTGEKGQGGSTITQQVARSLLLTPEKTYSRKIKEAILAYRINRALTKDEILHIYLNQIYLGSGAYGVETAAQTYFDKHAIDLNLAETSLLAGLPQAPSKYSPFKHFNMAKNRQAYVLNRMAEEGYITPTAARKTFKQPLYWAPPVQYQEENNYFLQEVSKYVENKYGKDLLLTGGLRIYTTLDQNLQKNAGMSVKRGVAKWAVREKTSVTHKTVPQTALVALEAKSGYVRAMTGGIDFNKSQFNRATQARRQPGSAFKPIIYAAALAEGFTPATVIVDEPLHLQGGRPGEVWEPKNFNGKFLGPTTLRNALVHSCNIVTIKILQDIGIKRVVTLAKKLGIHSPLRDNLSLALGSSEVSPLEMTAAYAAFANGGSTIKPILVAKIIDQQGNVLEHNTPSTIEALDRRTAYQVTRLLQSVIEEGTGRSVNSLGIPAAGKTGTTDQNMDAWFIGYTPEIVTGVWVGYDQKISLGEHETGGRSAAPIWLDFMEHAKKIYPSGKFEIPDGIRIIPINNITGMPDLQDNSAVSWEAFKTDRLPWPAPEELIEPEEVAGPEILSPEPMPLSDQEENETTEDEAPPPKIEY